MRWNIFPYTYHQLNTLSNSHHIEAWTKWLISIFFFLNGNVWILMKISPTFVPRGPISSIPTLAPKVAWCQSVEKPLSQPMIVSLLTHMCFPLMNLVLVWILHIIHLLYTYNLFDCENTPSSLLRCHCVGDLSLRVSLSFVCLSLNEMSQYCRAGLLVVYPLRGTQLIIKIWRLTSKIWRLISWILILGPS